MQLYNRVADNRPVNLDPCVSITAAAVRPEGVHLTINAPHDAGELLITLTASADRRWVTFELGDLSRWQGDPEQRHTIWPRFCPADMCPDGGETPSAPFVGGAFEGFRGAEGRYPDSAGYFTLNSVWQQYNVAMHVKEGDRLAYTLAPTAELPSIRAAVATAEAIPPPSPNRAKTWLWLGGDANETNLADSIAYGKQLGVEVLFFVDFLSNQGDYVVDRERWPSGLAAARARIEAAGLQTGLHMLSSWATTCYGLDAWVPPCPDSVAGWARAQRCPNHCAKSQVSEERPELFVPQGPAPHQYFWPNTAGTWYCHLQPAKNFYGPASPARPYPPPGNVTTDMCHDMTRLTMAGRDLPYGGGPVPPSNPIQLFNTRRSTLGRYRGGGAVEFDGESSYGILNHSEEYNFTENQWYPLAKSGFTLQLVVHPVQRQQTASFVVGQSSIVEKRDEWRLLLMPDGTLSWQVRMTSGWVTANGTTVLLPGEAYVVKATHEGGRIKIFACQLTFDFRCPLHQPEGTGHGLLPLQTGTADVWFGARGRSANGSLIDAFRGALEEIHLQRLSLENATAAVWPGGPGAGPVNYYMFDYSSALVREYWANQTARLINEVGAITAQWDGAEFQPCAALWDLPHSNRTVRDHCFVYSVRIVHAMRTKPSVVSDSSTRGCGWPITGVFASTRMVRVLVTCSGHRTRLQRST